MNDMPDVITRYYAASEQGDIGALVACFSDRATVLDDGRTYRGHDEIRGWRETLASAFTYTLDVVGFERLADDEYVVETHLEGTFPGGVVDLSQRFKLADDRIADLSM